MINRQKRMFAIGEVVEKLKKEYRRLSKSMLRFWEREGLILPKRTKGGHRKYSEHDIERMKIIVELRKKRYLPLPVVKHIIERLDQDPTYDLQIYDEICRPEDYDPTFKPLKRTEVVQQSGLTLDQIDAIEKMGFLPSLEGIKGDRPFDQEDLQILNMIKETVDIGLSIGDLRFYIDDMKNHIKNEAHFWKKVRRNILSTEERKTINRKILNNTRKLRNLLYRKYGGLEISDVLDT